MKAIKYIITAIIFAVSLLLMCDESDHTVGVFIAEKLIGIGLFLCCVKAAGWEIQKL